MFITFVFLKLETTKQQMILNIKHEFMNIKHNIIKLDLMKLQHVINYNFNLRTSNVYKHTLVKVIQHNMNSINVIIYNTIINL